MKKENKITFLPYYMMGVVLLVELKTITIHDNIKIDLETSLDKTLELKKATCHLGKCFVLEDLQSKSIIKNLKNGGFSIKFKNDKETTKIENIDIFLDSKNQNSLFMKFNSVEEAELWCHCN